MRVSSATVPPWIGTLKSTRTRARFPRKSTSRTVFFLDIRILSPSRFSSRDFSGGMREGGADGGVTSRPYTRPHAPKPLANEVPLVFREHPRRGHHPPSQSRLDACSARCKPSGFVKTIGPLRRHSVLA